MDRRIALFDLDRTITIHGTYTPFLLGVALRVQPWRLLFIPAALITMIAYKVKLLTRGQLKVAMLAFFLGHMHRDKLTPHIARFVQQRIQFGLRPGARTAISTHNDVGDRLVLATASFDFYAEEFGRRLGFHEVIATRSVWDSLGRLQFKINGENCYGSEKLSMVKAAKIRAKDTIFYSDDKSDLPTLSWVKESVVVNPRAAFKAIATARGFNIVNWP